MWALGEICYRMATGTPTFSDMLALLKWMQKPDYNFLHSLKSSNRDIEVDFIQSLMKADPQARLSADEALRHPWIDLSFLSSEPDIESLPPAAEQGWPQYPEGTGTMAFDEASAK